jgi:thiosulfate/3-mercaptopyruvate sulfurtransferase
VLVETAWLAEHLEDPDVVVVDLRWREDGSGRERYLRGHIPGAAFVDWATDLAEDDAPVAFTLASAERFAALMERCGIGERTTVVAYADAEGSGPFRLWIAASAYGHDSVQVLDGGLRRWVGEGRPLASGVEPLGPPAGEPWQPHAAERSWFASADDVEAASAKPGVAVVDSRPPSQFRGEAVWFETGPIPAGGDGIADTPRGKLRAGRVPWARNVPAAELYRPDGTMKAPEELRTLFTSVGVEAGTRAIAYCGVGISASALVFALRLAGVDEAALYDASWEQWGRDPRRPVARG